MSNNQRDTQFFNKYNHWIKLNDFENELRKKLDIQNAKIYFVKDTLVINRYNIIFEIIYRPGYLLTDPESFFIRMFNVNNSNPEVSEWLPFGFANWVLYELLIEEKENFKAHFLLRQESYLSSMQSLVDHLDKLNDSRPAQFRYYPTISNQKPDFQPVPTWQPKSSNPSK